MKLKAAFFDRDGVLNVDKSYLYKIEDLEWIDGAKEALAYLTKKGYTIFVVTNQSGIARGYYTVGDMQKLHHYMAQQIAEAGGKIEKFYYCPHLPGGAVAEFAVECDCRKPKPGLILRAFEEYDIDLTGKNVTILGRSNIVGKPLIQCCLNKNATVTVCHSKTKDLKEHTKNADIVISAIGKAKFVTADMIKDGAVVIDVGINRDESGKIVGDVDFEKVS